MPDSLPDSDNDNDNDQPCDQHSEDGDQDGNAGKNLGNDSDCESASSKEGLTTIGDEIGWDHDTEMYGARKPIQVGTHCKPC